MPIQEEAIDLQQTTTHFKDTEMVIWVPLSQKVWAQMVVQVNATKFSSQENSYLIQVISRGDEEKETI